MSMRFGTVFSLSALLLSGCATAPQEHIGLAGDYFGTRSNRIGVAVVELPKPDTLFPGASCLLCLATASIANSEMTSAVRTWPTDDLKPLKGDLVQALVARGQLAVAIDDVLDLSAVPDRKSTEPGFARKDFSNWKTKEVDRLLIVNLRALGAWRNYSAYIPTGAPQAVFKGEAYIVDLTTHKLDWYQTFDLARASEGNWDEPPKFPGLTNAYFQVLEEGKDAIKKAFVQ